MYTAKAAGKRRVAVFEPDDARGDRRAPRALGRARRGASAAASWSSTTSRSSSWRPAGPRRRGAVRWRHPTRGLIGPDEFIALAEENGTDPRLGRWVLAEACRQVAAWEARPALDDDFFVSVNLSPLQLQQPEFIDEIEAILERDRPRPAGWSSS